jgi:hypothetical protein
MSDTAAFVQEDVSYQIITSKCKTHGVKPDEVYGIRAVCSQGAAEIEDICTTIHDMKRLIGALTGQYVTPDQLLYIVEDFLEELYGKPY